MGYRSVLFLIVGTVMASAAGAQQLPAPKDLSRETKVVLRVPESMGKVVGDFFTYDLEIKNAKITINGTAIESGVGYPDARVFSKTRSGGTFGQREFLLLRDVEKGGKEIRILLPRNPADQVAQLLNRVLAPAEQRASIRDSLERATVGILFPGFESVLPYEVRLTSTREQMALRRPFLGFMLIRDSTPSVMAMPGASDYVYNELQLGASERAARTIETAVLPALKAHEDVFLALPDSISLIRVSISVAHRPFSRPASETSTTSLLIESPRNEVVGFLAAKATAQEMIDRSRVLLGGSLIKPRID